MGNTTEILQGVAWCWCSADRSLGCGCTDSWVSAAAEEKPRCALPPVHSLPPIITVKGKNLPPSGDTAGPWSR